MKRLSFTVIILLSTIWSFPESKGQTLKNIILKQQIDTLYIFPSIGVIKCYYQGKLTPDDSLTYLFKESLNQIIPQTANFKIVVLDNSYDLSDSLKKYFVNVIPRFSKMTPEAFSKIDIGEDFTRMIAPLSGKYFGIIFFDGFENQNYEKQMGQAVAFAFATAALTGGMYYALPVPEKPYFVTDVLIIDKTENRFLFYKRRTQAGSPLSYDNIKKNYLKIFEKYTKN